MKNKGFTLIEFLVACAVFALFTYTLYTLFSGGLKAYKKGETITLLKKKSSEFLDRLSTDLHQAKSITPQSSWSASLSFVRFMQSSSSSDTITYSYDNTNGAVTRNDSDDGYSFSFGDSSEGENIYFYSSRSDSLMFYYDPSSQTLQVSFFVQYGTDGRSLADGAFETQYGGWKRLKLLNTISVKLRESALPASADTGGATIGDGATADPGSPPDRVRFGE